MSYYTHIYTYLLPLHSELFKLQPIPALTPLTKKIYRKTVHPIHLLILPFYFNALNGVWLPSRCTPLFTYRVNSLNRRHKKTGLSRFGERLSL